MTNKSQSSFPTVDPAGITPGHDEAVTNPPEPRTHYKDESEGGCAGSKKQGVGDTSQEGTPDTDLVSIGTNSSNQPV